jgi:methionyl-tRNA formyltransferase
MKSSYGFLQGAWNFFRRCGPIYTIYIWFITTFAEAIGFLTGKGSILARARANRIPVFRTRDVNDEKGLHFIRQLQPQVLITAHFDQKLLHPLCDGIEFAVVNLHPSSLPWYKGLEPVLRSYFDKKTPPGITLHRLSLEIDGGRILAIASGVKISGESIFSQTCELMQIGVRMLDEKANELLDFNSGLLQTKPGSYHSWPTSSEIWDFISRNGSLISIKEVYDCLKR